MQLLAPWAPMYRYRPSRQISGCSGRRAQNVLISHRQEAVDHVSEARVISDERRSKL
jgi:hypothetical protein